MVMPITGSAPSSTSASESWMRNATKSWTGSQSSSDGDHDEHAQPTTLREQRNSGLKSQTLSVQGSKFSDGVVRTTRPPFVPLKQRLVSLCRMAVESTWITVFTTVLTVYALIGDDFRLLATNRTSDPVFDALTGTCIAVFGLEIVLSTVGKDDYFLSFFFLLDVVSTITLFLDLTAVNDAILGDEEDVSNMKGSRAAKIGARATRVVRVVRLVRILKLYKAVYEAQLHQRARAAKRRRMVRAKRLERRAAREGKNNRLEGGYRSSAKGSSSKGQSRTFGRSPTGMNGSLSSERLTLANGTVTRNGGSFFNHPGGGNEDTDMEDWEDEDAGDEESAKDLINRESRVGKKLSELTTRKVIILVLAMMLSNQLLRVDQAGNYATSATYAADLVSEAFAAMSSNATETNRRKYEKAFLGLVYYHNWYTGQMDKCPVEEASCSALYSSNVFWGGIVSSRQDLAIEKAAEASITAVTLQAWELQRNSRESSQDTAYFYNFGGFPNSVLQRLGEPWTKDCNSLDGQYNRRGISFLQEELETPVRITYAVQCPQDLRRQERKKYAARLNVDERSFQEWHIAFYFDLRPFVKQDAVFSLLITVFICIALCGASLVFSSDANRLVLTPLENMICKVEKIRDNPMAARKVADEDFKKEEIMRAKTMAKERKPKTHLESTKNFLLCYGSAAKKVELMETVILERTIIKLGSLLALGFGEAGASIIEHNMSGMDSASIDAMVAGVKLECIIGAIRIRDFSTVTEVLQEKVMTFVNQIAEIVHGVVDEFHGYASKNNGDLFLMIWRTGGLDEEMVCKLGDMSLVAILRILTAVQRSFVLAQYRAHPALQQRLGSDTKVQLSAGLHFGWAIEGAVGSEFKVDAAYLSPNVSQAESLEMATKLYGVHILMSEMLIKICTPAFAGKCRLIDRVIVPGSIEPMRVYTMDLNLVILEVEDAAGRSTSRWTTRQRFRVRQFMEHEKSRKLRPDARMVTCFNEMDIMKSRARFTMEFLHVFSMGYQNYHQGEWRVAQRLLEQTKSMLGAIDGPSSAILNFMQKHDFQAPNKWQGVRPLTASEMQLDSTSDLPEGFTHTSGKMAS